MKPAIALALIPLFVTACARYDYHGMDPKTYNEVLYPKENTVHDMQVFHSFYFTDHKDVFDRTTLAEFDAFLGRAHPSAIYKMQIVLPVMDGPRETYITRLLRARGIKFSSMETLVDNSLAPNEAVIEMGYSYVEPPLCPDWRKDSVTNYSNTKSSNAYCATAVNLGAQIANPRDLVGSSTSRIKPDATRGSIAIQGYRTGENTAGGSGAAE